MADEWGFLRIDGIYGSSKHPAHRGWITISGLQPDDSLGRVEPPHKWKTGHVVQLLAYVDSSVGPLVSAAHSGQPLKGKIDQLLRSGWSRELLSFEEGFASIVLRGDIVSDTPLMQVGLTLVKFSAQPWPNWGPR